MRELFLINIIIFLFGCHYPESRIIAENLTEKTEDGTEKKDSFPKNELAQLVISGNPTTSVDVARPYSNIIFEKKEVLNSAPGTKSVLFNTSGTRLYAMPGALIRSLSLWKSVNEWA